MNNIVYYLSFYGEQLGFLFPNELPDNYYSPGLFLVETDNAGAFAYEYMFDAMDNGNRISLKLIRADENDPYSTLYVVRTKHYGSFWFNLKDINKNLRYVGVNPKVLNHNSMAVAISADAEKLERVCEKFNFYFIGSTLTGND